MSEIDLSLLVLRIGFGLSLVAHGLNKMMSSSGLDGTSAWFASLGMKWPKTQARLAAYTEVIAGLCFAAGLLTSMASALIIALMVVAIITVHWRVGYFIFLPNGGWEYCASIIVVAVSVSISGAGTASFDHLWNLPTAHAAFPLAAGFLAPLCHLALCYRPRRD